MNINRIQSPDEIFRSRNIMFAPRPRACFAFILVPSELVLEMDAAGCLGQVPNIMWRAQKMNFLESLPGSCGYTTSSSRDDENLRCSEISSEIFDKNKEKIRYAASAFLPRDINSYGSVDVMALACTSMSFSLGPSLVEREIRMGYPTVTVVTDMATAVKEALISIAVRKGKYSLSNGDLNEPRVIKPLRILLLTPYMDELHQKNIDFITNDEIYPGSSKENSRYPPRFEIVHSENLRLPSDEYTTAVEPDWILKKIKEMALKYGKLQSRDSAVGTGGDNKEFCWNVVCIGCSGFRSTGYGFIDRCEKELSSGYYGDEQPFVITSTQATMWHALHKSGKIPFDEISKIKGYGQLFSIEHC